MGTFLTTIEFIKKAEKVHGYTYDYSLVNYVNSKEKVKIICRKHGEFTQRPNDHLQKKGCIECAGTKRKNNKDFISKARLIHGDKYDYSVVSYKNNSTKVKIICLKHGEFKQIPESHLNGFGCSKCSRVKKLTNDEFIKRAQSIHHNYDYSLVDYKNMHTKVIIICKKHGEFKQTPHNHLKFAGCPKCNKSKGEKIISWFLDKKNIKYKEQETFEGCKNKSPLPFDFYLQKENICIEFQGIQHFEANEHMGGETGLENRRKNDKIKKHFCKKNNIKLIEIKYSDEIVTKLKESLNIK
jgi:hypothetical protein